MKKWVKILIAAGCTAASAALICGHTLSCVPYEIESDKICSPVKIAFISDFHNSWYGEGQKEITESVDKFGADIVCFGGDLFDEHNGENNSWELVDALVKRYPCYYTVGNHEFKTHEPERYKSEMEKRGVTVLDNSMSEISVNGQKLRICGAEEIDGIYDGGLAEENSGGVFSLLLYHWPQDFPLISESGFDLILSGHAHGGQWRIPFLLNGVYAPGQGIFPKYAGGRYEENGTAMLVSRGLYRQLSCFIIPRIFNNPELLLITLK